MDFALDRDQKWLIECLTATLDTSHEIRSFAEASLRQASLQPGYGAALTKITVSKDFPFGLRQLAAVLLKQYIKQHWEEGEENFIYPLVSVEEKRIIHQLLLPPLNDPNRKIRTAISMAVVSIAQYDWPDDWPELLPFLLRLIGDRTNISSVHGGLKCLALLSGELDDTLVPKLLPTLYPHLHSIISAPDLYEKSLRTKALSILHSCISVIGSMSGVYKTETSGLMMQMINSLMEQFSLILHPPLHLEDPGECSMRMEVLKCLLQLVQSFPGLIESQFSAILSSLWQTFVSSADVYQLSSVRQTEDHCSDRFDSDGDERGLSAFIIQMFETLTTIVGNSKMSKAIKGSITELAYYTIAFLQMTEEQVHIWSLDANQYVADEDDVTYSCRVSGSLLLEQIANSYGGEIVASIFEAAKKRFRESQTAKASGSPDWWKLREASFFALSSISEQILEAQLDSEAVKVNVIHLLEESVAEDIRTDMHQFPFLHARIFSVVSKFSSLISQATREQFLFSAAQALALDSPPPVKIGSCQALSHLLPDAEPKLIQPHIMNIISSLIDLLKQASDETLHLVLETLQAAVKAGHELSSFMEPVISPVILDVWVRYVSDPFISIDAMEVLEAIKGAPGCMQPLVSRIVPSIAAILENPTNQPAGLLAGSFDLLTMLLKSSPIDAVKAIFNRCFDSTIKVVLESDDQGEIQNATECLSAFLAGGKHDLLSWNGDPSLTMKMLLEAASRLLNPSTESSAALFAGRYLLQLLFQFPSEMAFHIRDLVAAIVRRMQSSEIIGLKCSLIVVLARLVHFSSPDINQFINLLMSVPSNGHENSFHYLMPEWTKLQGEIQGVYQIKVTTTALALLLSTRNDELAKVHVHGHLVETNSGITTRSRAKLAPDQWTIISLSAKIFSLLSDALVEIQEQILEDNDDSDEDNNWEEVSNCNGTTKDHKIRLIALESDESDDHNSEEELVKDDPLNDTNLAAFLAHFFANLYDRDRLLFDHFSHSLTHSQRIAVEKVTSKCS